MQRVRFTSGEALVVRVVAVANVVVLLMAGALLMTLVVRAGDEYGAVKAATAAERANAADAACRRDAPDTEAGYAALWNSLDPARWASADAVAQLPLDGRTVWLYGATTTRRDGNAAVTAWSSAITQRGGCVHVSHLGEQVLPDDPSGAVYSLTGGVATGPDSLIVTAERLRPSGDCIDCTTEEGTRAAEVHVDPQGDLSFVRWIPMPEGGVNWGVALSTDGTTVAVYGTQRDMTLVGRQVKVAVVELGNFTDLRRWRTAPGVIAAGVKDALTAWHDASGWHVATLPDAATRHDGSTTWSSRTAGGQYRGKNLPSSDADRRFTIGGRFMPTEVAASAGR